MGSKIFMSKMKKVSQNQFLAGAYSVFIKFSIKMVPKYSVKSASNMNETISILSIET